MDAFKLAGIKRVAFPIIAGRDYFWISDATYMEILRSKSTKPNDWVDALYRDGRFKLCVLIQFWWRRENHVLHRTVLYTEAKRQN